MALYQKKKLTITWILSYVESSDHGVVNEPSKLLLTYCVTYSTYIKLY